MASAAANEGGSATVSAADIPTNEEDLDVFVKELMENSALIYSIWWILLLLLLLLLLQLTKPPFLYISLYKQQW